MTQKTDYGKYLFGTGQERLEELAIFEIGGSEGPIYRSLSQRNANRVIYREIDSYAYRDYFIFNKLNRWKYEDFSRQMLREHHGVTEGIDALTLRWDGGDIPYPFPDDSFDEFHCHMVTSAIIGRSVGPRHIPTPEIFADEVNRLLKTHGRIYLTTDGSGIFEVEGNRFSEQEDSMVEPADRLIKGLLNHGFSLNELDASRSFYRRLPGNDYRFQIKEARFDPIIPFTDIHNYPALILIATKTQR